MVVKFRHLSMKNVKESWYQYAAYFFCCTFSVTIFFIFQSFILHPAVTRGFEAGRDIQGILVTCQFLIVFFSFFFVLYSNSAFIRSRKKEIGLLMLFGMTRKQLKKLIFYENSIVGILSIITGILTGMLLSKLFFMTVSVILNLSAPIPFTIVPNAVVITVCGYLLLFQVITFVTLFLAGRRTIIKFLHKQPSGKVTFFTVILALFGVACTVTGYYLACVVDFKTLGPLMAPVVGLVTIGTYFLFRNGSVLFFRFLEKQTFFYYRRTNLLAVSQLAGKMRENASVLFNVTIISAVILTAAGTTYTAVQVMKGQIYDRYPQTISVSAKKTSVQEVVSPAKIQQILKRDGIKIQYKTNVTGVPVNVQTDQYSDRILLVSESNYNKTAEKMGRILLNPGKGGSVYVFPYSVFNLGVAKIGPESEVSIEGRKIPLHIERVIKGSVVNEISSLGNEMLVLDDEQYRRIADAVPNDQTINYVGYELINWKEAGDTVEKIQALIPEKKQSHLASRVGPVLTTNQNSGLALFIGVFISFLFFIAAGSLIYFKLFTDLPEDVARLKALRRIGVTDREMSRVMTIQIAVIFFVPFFIATAHAIFAFIALRNLMFANVFLYTSIVVATFFVIQVIYFFITRRVYMNQLFTK